MVRQDLFQLFHLFSRSAELVDLLPLGIDGFCGCTTNEERLSHQTSTQILVTLEWARISSRGALETGIFLYAAAGPSACSSARLSSGIRLTTSSLFHPIWSYRRERAIREGYG